MVDVVLVCASTLEAARNASATTAGRNVKRMDMLSSLFFRRGASRGGSAPWYQRTYALRPRPSIPLEWDDAVDAQRARAPGSRGSCFWVRRAAGRAWGASERS